MRLSQILEGSMDTLKPLYGPQRLRQFKNVLGFMPQKKVKHSLRVGATAARSGLSPDEVEAAILHDYIERGGNLEHLDELNISPRTIRIMKMLSLDEKTPGLDDTEQVQQHIEQMLRDQSLDQHEKNVAIIVKCADRIDNLAKRMKADNLTQHYAWASNKLFQTLLSGYTGDPALISHVKKKISKMGLDQRL